MQNRLVVFDLFLPTDQHSTKAIQPAMCSLHHPTARFKALTPYDLRLLFPRPDMRFITTVLQVGFQPFGILTFIHTQAESFAWSAPLKCIKRL
ncbi:hypothetical protein JV35_21165 [Pectobacterium betavasculorum]|uniref:Transposase n=1 Tax=Pectobacterium betavasculorum TaxID=55207 RepID=A0ABR4UTU9_9GAMM|nr:hypothetical protein JV35_21165 [Pectobacterium betavasculorum]